MEQLHTIFVHIPSLRVLICQECQIGCVKTRIQSHLNVHHKYLSTAARAEIVQAARSIPDLVGKDDDIVFSSVAIAPIPCLACYKDGLKCRGTTASGHACRVIYQRRDDMLKHQRKEHGYQNPRKRGRPSRGGSAPENQPWLAGVHYQKLATGGKIGRPFEIHVPNTRQPSEEVDAVTQQLEAVFTSTASAI